MIVGGGPAGIAPLIAAHRSGRLPQLLAGGVVIAEKGSRIGAGDLGRYGIASDSSGDTFVSCLHSTVESELTALMSHPLSTAIAAAGSGAVPLAKVGEFLDVVGATLLKMVASHPACDVLTRHEAVSSTKCKDDSWLTVLRGPDGRERKISSDCVVLATGASQPAERLAGERVGGEVLVDRCGDKLLQSGDVLATTGLSRVSDLLSGTTAPRVAIIGGSTSAAAVAHALLNRLPRVKFEAGGVTLLHRRELRIYYPSVAEALAEGYDEFTDDDICPISKRVFRLAGFRLDSRELIMRARGIGGLPPEPRLRLHRLQPHDPAALRIIDEADLVVAALGYRPRALQIFDQAGEAMSLGSARGPQSALVDGQCRIVDAAGEAIPGLFGIGLGAGFVPRGKLGGERSFTGQANGLWLWQNDVGALIVDAVLAAPTGARIENLDAALALDGGDRKVPLTKPTPPRLSLAGPLLKSIEESGIYSNFGPVNTRFERQLLTQLFGSQGACMTVCNATLGLMVAVRALVEPKQGVRRYALMPSFTFAAAAHAAMWCGLTPLLCDIDPEDWAASAEAEEKLLRLYGDDIAVIMPYATFGFDIDLGRYEALSRKYGIPVVVDAAASLGTVSRNGFGFGTGFSGAVVFSMHATKSFSTGEGGLIYSGDEKLIAATRTMCNFGFGRPRNATMAGINAKLSEVGALVGELRLKDYHGVVERRAQLLSLYREGLPEFQFQPLREHRQAHQFASSLLPQEFARHRGTIQERLTARGIGTAAYFSPHLAQQDYFKVHAKSADLAVCDDVGDRVISMPLFDEMTDADALYVVRAVKEELVGLRLNGSPETVTPLVPTVSANTSICWDLRMPSPGVLSNGAIAPAGTEVAVGR